jgi:hypothetical protein
LWFGCCKQFLPKPTNKKPAATQFLYNRLLNGTAFG